MLFLSYKSDKSILWVGRHLHHPSSPVAVILVSLNLIYIYSNNISLITHWRLWCLSTAFLSELSSIIPQYEVNIQCLQGMYPLSINSLQSTSVIHSEILPWTLSLSIIMSLLSSSLNIPPYDGKHLCFQLSHRKRMYHIERMETFQLVRSGLNFQFLIVF
jgi:hypothetical protein